MGPVIGDLGEDALIALFATGGGEPGPEVLVPNGDDAAAFCLAADRPDLGPCGGAVVVTTDALVEGVHFDLAYASPRRVGRKLLAVNLSDVAAMGATPRYVFLALALPERTPVEVARGLADGVHEACSMSGVLVLGGNVSRTAGPLVLTATLIGTGRPGALVTRRGARPGDVLLVTGTLGDARAGLEVAAARGRALSEEDPFFALFERQVDPRARVEAGPVLAGRARAMCDVSDGLARDLFRLLEGGALGAELELCALPTSAALRRYAGEAPGRPAAELYALRGGEDYELLFALSPEDVGSVTDALRATGTEATPIGRVTAGPGVTVLEEGVRRPLSPEGFDHFRARSE